MYIYIYVHIIIITSSTQFRHASEYFFTCSCNFGELLNLENMIICKFINLINWKPTKLQIWCLGVKTLSLICKTRNEENVKSQAGNNNNSSSNRNSSSSKNTANHYVYTGHCRWNRDLEPLFMMPNTYSTVFNFTIYCYLVGPVNTYVTRRSYLHTSSISYADLFTFIYIYICIYVYVYVIHIHIYTNINFRFSEN
jgi:hypothetical protein